MTISEIKTRIRDIGDHQGDPKRAHAMEDELVWDFVADLAFDGSAHAIELMKSREMEFPRYCS